MLRNQLYYVAKPFLPAALRLRVRRWFAEKKRRRFQHSWPILPGSEKPPEGWKGWPEGKTFAFVLTHDVEGQLGVDQVPPLMQLELDLGFRSSFNFIPEGPYKVSNDLVATLRRNGFEVGIHDLHHDGKLYRGRREFQGKASRINTHLKNWGAVGFRSGFMLRQLDWLHELEVLYDASTFDTDPFEPQPDGAGTIFPFWVLPEGEFPGTGPRTFLHPGSRGEEGPSRGYVELPYTLPQDSTVFNLFQERDIRIWREKLDWIATHGGMALLNLHPDYVNFGADGQFSTFQYPARLYREFLEYVSRNYGKECWCALPRDVATFVCTSGEKDLPGVVDKARLGR